MNRLLSFFYIVTVGCLTGIVYAQDSLTVIHHLSYDILYNNEYHCPSVVQWPLNYKYLGEYSRRPHKIFEPDKMVPKPKVDSKSYTLSGYDRGHMCPSGDRGCCLDYWEDTFIMTNIAPQTPTLNRGAWKAAEEECRAMAKTGCDLTVIAIPLWIDSISPNFGSPSIRVPSHFYKRANCHTHKGHTIHWLMRNTSQPQIMPGCVISPDSANKVLEGVRTKIE